MSVKTKLSPDQQSQLINILKTRFEKNSVRHENINWENVQKKLESNPEKLWSLHEMERTEGEPDVVAYDKKQTNISSSIVPQKVQKADAVFATTEKP